MSRLVQILLDVVLVVVFAAIGRRSHAEGLAFAEVLRTAAPFLGGTLIAWVALLLRGQSLSLLKHGLIVVASTVVLGMLFRAMIGQGVQASFIGVTTVALSVFLLGWRGIATLLARRSRPTV